MKTLKFIFIASLLLFFYDGCKKGDGDPLFSLRSRKARVTGDWKVTKYEEKDVNTSNTGTTTNNSSFDGSTWAETTVNTGGTSTLTGTATYTFSFTKDGKYTMKRTITSTNGGLSYSTMWSEEGKWDFLSGVGDLKNKEYIGLTKTLLTIISGNSTNSTTFQGQSYIAWQITTLKNKEMILNSIDEDANSSSGGTSSTGNSAIEITLEQ